MNIQEKMLYHQIHPVKLSTDTTVGIVASWLLWRRRLLSALAIMVVPPILASFLLIRLADLEKYKTSPFGHYIREYMTPATQATRGVGWLIAATGAWRHSSRLIAAGWLTVVLAWMRGVILPKRNA